MDLAGAIAAGPYPTTGLPAGFVPSPATGPASAPAPDGGDAEELAGATGLGASAKDTPTKDDEAGLLTLPLTRIKRMVKEEGDVRAISGEAAFAITRATELFLEELAMHTAAHVPPTSKRGITYREVSQAVAEYKPCDFLAGVYKTNGSTPTSMVAATRPRPTCSKAGRGWGGGKGGDAGGLSLCVGIAQPRSPWPTVLGWGRRLAEGRAGKGDGQRLAPRLPACTGGNAGFAGCQLQCAA